MQTFGQLRERIEKARSAHELRRVVVIGHWVGLGGAAEVLRPLWEARVSASREVDDPALRRPGPTGLLHARVSQFGGYVEMAEWYGALPYDALAHTYELLFDDGALMVVETVGGCTMKQIEIDVYADAPRGEVEREIADALKTL